MSTNQVRREASLMNLDALIETRQAVDTTPLPIDEKELLSRYERLYTGLVSDVLREFLLLDQALPGAIVPLRPELTVAGIAFTVKSAPNPRVSGEMEVRTTMLTELTPDAFVMWDTTGDQDATCWGGVMTATAMSMGVRGACIDGGLRDTHQVLERKFPVFYRYRGPNGSLGRCQIIDYQKPIIIGGVLIRPGDIILGDIDGVVAVPRSLALQVLTRAEELRSTEEEIFSWVDDGESVQEITKRGGYF
jgi:4-hydroxy-4-methyl-2-oxoglutarate aldolase